MRLVREAEKSGTWYSADPQTLAAELDGYLRHAGGGRSDRLAAAIAPHAGLAYSGAVAARVYAWLAETNPELETLLLFGAVHTASLARPAIWPAGAWQTPLGEVEVDERLADKLIAAGVGESLPEPHFGDNAIELQLPFVKRCLPRTKIVPIATPPLASAAEAGVTAHAVVGRAGLNCAAVGSTDLTHYGRAFRFHPAGFGAAAVAWSKENDGKLLALLERLEAEEIVPAAGRDRSACGAGAAAAVTAYARAAGCKRGTVLEHTTSYDVAPGGDASHFVGYAAVTFPVAG